MMDNVTTQVRPNVTPSDEAAEQSAPPVKSGGLPPSTWTAVWVAGALAYLVFARRSFARLG